MRKWESCYYRWRVYSFYVLESIYGIKIIDEIIFRAFLDWHEVLDSDLGESKGKSFELEKSIEEKNALQKTRDGVEKKRRIRRENLEWRFTQ